MQKIIKGIKGYFTDFRPVKIIEMAGLLSLVLPIFVISKEVVGAFLVGVYGSLLTLAIGITLYFRLRKKELKKETRYGLYAIGVVCVYLTINTALVQGKGLTNFSLGFCTMTTIGGWSLLLAGYDELRRWMESKENHQLLVSITCLGHGIPLTLLSSFLITIGILTSF